MTAMPMVTTAALTIALTMALIMVLTMVLTIWRLLWHLLLQAFSIVPAECIIGRRLGFYYELVATLLLPALSFGVVSLIALQPSP